MSGPSSGDAPRVDARAARSPPTDSLSQVNNTNKRQKLDGGSNGNKTALRRNSASSLNRVLGRRCFVTIGATAAFRQLLVEIIQPEFLKCLSDNGFDVLEVQCGPDYDWFQEQVNALAETSKHGIDITCFALTNNMASHMLACRGEAGIRLAGCVISHAGSGTILEVMRYQAPLIVVPNPTLMDNHQAELAEECEAQNWAVYGKLGNLPEAILRSQERLVQGRLDDLPPYSPDTFPVPERERVTLFDWMVLTCYPEELARQEHLRDLDRADAKFLLEKEQERQQRLPPLLSSGEDPISRLQVD